MSDNSKSEMSSSNSKSGSGVMKAASILMVLNFLASILGYIRGIIITSTFGMGMESDAYTAAFTIPDLIYSILVGGGLSSAFVPVFRSYLDDGKPEEGSRMASTILNIVAIISGLASLIGIIFAPMLVPLIVDLTKFGPEFFTLSVRLTRIMFFQSFFMCLTGICMGILQSYKNFTPTSVGSVCYNLTIIVVGLLLYKFGFGIAGFSIAVVLGAVVHFSIQVFAISKKDFKYKFMIDWHHPGLHKFLMLFWPMLLGISVSQLNVIVNKYFGSGQGQSNLTAMQNAISLQQLPINMIGFSIAIAVFPTLVEHVSKGHMENYKKELSMAIRNMIFLTLPATFGLIAVREPLVRALYYQGEFTLENVNTLSTLILFYSMGITAYCVRQVLLQGFYSLQITSIPVKINIVILLSNIVFSYFFVKIWGINGLGLAYSLAGFMSVTLLVIMLRKKVGQIKGREIFSSSFKILIACIVMYAAIFISNYMIEQFVDRYNKMSQIFELGVGLIVGVIVYFITAYLLKMRELKAGLEIISRKLHIKLELKGFEEED